MEEMEKTLCNEENAEFEEVNDNYELTNYDCDTEDNEEDSSGISTGLAMVIGGGIALGVYAGVKKLRKLWQNFKLKKEVNHCSEDEIVDVDNEVIVDVDNDNV